MTIRGSLGRIYDILFREFPHRAQTGLFRNGIPGRDSPVILTGNYTETVRRLKKSLRRIDAWLLVANSKGINVWCAAGGGHLTHHDVISVILTSGINEMTDNHTVILPQLIATGVERKKVTDATGWKTIWGPARLEDLPEFLKQKHRSSPSQRLMRFPPFERIEMATMWGIPMLVIGFLLFLPIGGWRAGLSVGVSGAVVSYTIFLLLPWLLIKGNKKWLTFSAFALFGMLSGWTLLFILGGSTSRELFIVGIGAVIEILSLSVDIAGTTPWYGSYINTFRNNAHIDLVQERCNGSGDCIQVCPRNVFELNGQKRKADFIHPEDCIECGACVVQCPSDALRFKYDDGKVVEAGTIRRTRMNMLGRRSVLVHEQQP